jgi:hypothetical protein
MRLFEHRLSLDRLHCGIVYICNLFMACTLECHFHECKCNKAGLHVYAFVPVVV